jgi:hypothetical protein
VAGIRAGDDVHRAKGSHALNGTVAHSWPPREGVRFFLLWVAGTVAAATLNKLVMFSIQFGAPGSALAGTQVNVVYAAVGVALGAWHAWLLFPFGWRMLAWAVLPLPSYGRFYLIASNPSGRLAVFYPALMLLQGFLQFLLLIGVRRRPWLWLIAIIGEGLISSAVGLFITFAGTGVFDRFAALLPGISGMQILSAAISGSWLLGNIAAAAVLAWWMAPLCER